MAVVGALLESRPAALALRRALAARGLRLVRCRTPLSIATLCRQRVVDAVVVAPARVPAEVLAGFRRDFPAIPVAGFAAFRPDDAETLLACRAHGFAALAVAGVDEAIVGEMVARCSLGAARARALADGPRALRLADPLQRRVWDVAVAQVETPLRTADIAKALGASREHLSRQFGAGGAPNLKRVIDVARIACAAQLLANPAYDRADVARLLAFASASHLAVTARRVAGASMDDLAGLGPRGVLQAFVRGKTRSRDGLPG